MRYEHVDERDIGSLFIDAEGRVWKMTAYIGEPQATFEPMFPASRLQAQDIKFDETYSVTHAVGSLNYAQMGLRKLQRQGDTE